MTEHNTDLIAVEVAYALPASQWIFSLAVQPGTTAMEAIQLSGVLQQHPEIDIENCKIGIFGKLVSRDTALREMDRVEIYRRLIVNAKEARRQRASNQKK